MYLDKIPLVIGYKIEKALRLIGEDYSVIVDSTTVPYEDRKAERQGNTPVVIRQKVVNDGIVLTTSLFK